MRVLLIVDAYVPGRFSAALQMHDFAMELRAQGHEPLVITPAPGLGSPWMMDEVDGVQVLRVNTAKTKDVGLIRRAVAECLLPWNLWRGLKKSPLAAVRWDGVVWYSPTIFFGPMVAMVKRSSGCRAYLILRDLFPDWAVDTGLMRRGLAYRFFKWVERFQYSVADIIGVQTAANMPLVERECTRSDTRIEVLNNWLSDRIKTGETIDIGSGPLAGRTVFVYTGNMGTAQGMDCLIDLATGLRHRNDIGFLFVGRGSDVPRLRALVVTTGLQNVVFMDEVDSDQIPGILRQCHVGLIALDPRHTTHNIPGKFLTYLRAGLPVLARINAGNDLESLINVQGIGRVCVGTDQEQLQQYAEELALYPALRAHMGKNAKRLADRKFSSSHAVSQLIGALRGDPARSKEPAAPYSYAENMGAMQKTVPNSSGAPLVPAKQRGPLPDPLADRDPNRSATIVATKKKKQAADKV